MIDWNIDEDSSRIVLWYNACKLRVEGPWAKEKLNEAFKKITEYNYLHPTKSGLYEDLLKRLKSTAIINDAKNDAIDIILKHEPEEWPDQNKFAYEKRSLERVLVRRYDRTSGKISQVKFFINFSYPAFTKEKLTPWTNTFTREEMLFLISLFSLKAETELRKLIILKEQKTAPVKDDAIAEWELRLSFAVEALSKISLVNTERKMELIAYLRNKYELGMQRALKLLYLLLPEQERAFRDRMYTSFLDQQREDREAGMIFALYSGSIDPTMEGYDFEWSLKQSIGESQASALLKEIDDIFKMDLLDLKYRKEKAERERQLQSAGWSKERIDAVEASYAAELNKKKEIQKLFW